MAKFSAKTKRQELAEKAVRYAKAVVILETLLGKDSDEVVSVIEIPHFRNVPKRELEAALPSIERDLHKLAKILISDWDRARLRSATTWLAKKFDDWIESKHPIFELGRVHEVEAQLGTLPHRLLIDCPPYAQVLIQGMHGAAIRHPEYHLATDLALLYNLFLDAQQIIDDFWRRRILHSSEHVQSLGRSVILACFNLLESFVSGIAAAHLIEVANVSEEARKVLEDERASLRNRFFKFPNLITGRTIVDPNKQPFKDLFGPCKAQRDSFVHCEPGPTASHRGVVKEEQFHDITTKGVKNSVELTCAAICILWKGIHGNERPTWLPVMNEEGRFEGVSVQLARLKVS